MNIKKLFQILCIFFIISGITFLLIHSFIVTRSSNEDFARDIFGFPIPHPPVWTSYIPFVGSILGFVFEFFSFHGLIGTVITGVFLCIGGFLLMLADEKKG